MLTVGISGIKEFGLNVMLLCNICAESIERDNFMRGRELASASEKISTFDMGDKLKNVENKLTN